MVAQAGSWDLGYWVQEQLNEIRRRLLSWFSHTRMVKDSDHFKDIVPYQSFARTSPPRTASPILRRVPMKIFCKAFLQLRKSCNRLSRKNQPYHRRRLNQYG